MDTIDESITYYSRKPTASLWSIADRSYHCRVFFLHQPCLYDNYQLSVPKAGNRDVTGDWVE